MLPNGIVRLRYNIPTPAKVKPDDSQNQYDQQNAIQVSHPFSPVVL
jgi:hypothetical protein